jgi:hypothetical protein
MSLLFYKPVYGHLLKTIDIEIKERYTEYLPVPPAQAARNIYASVNCKRNGATCCTKEKKHSHLDCLNIDTHVSNLLKDILNLFSKKLANLLNKFQCVTHIFGMFSCCFTFISLLRNNKLNLLQQ